MLEPSELRERLTQFCFISKQNTDIGHRLNSVLSQTVEMEPVWKKIQNAVKTGLIPANRYNSEDRIRAAGHAGVITAEEVNKLNAFEALRQEIIKVNEFSFDLAEVIA